MANRTIEYKIVKIYPGQTNENDEMMLNSMGAVGWDLVTINTKLSPPLAYFKREVTDG